MRVATESGASIRQTILRALEIDPIVVLKDCDQRTALKDRQMNALVDSGRVCHRVLPGGMSAYFTLPVLDNPHVFEHVLGLVRLRHESTWPVDRWTYHLQPNGQGAVPLPDAEGYNIHGYRIAFEFDAGQYSRKRIREKARAYATGSFAEQIWGVTSAKRARLISRLLREIPVPHQVVVLDPRAGGNPPTSPTTPVIRTSQK